MRLYQSLKQIPPNLTLLLESRRMTNILLAVIAIALIVNYAFPSRVIITSTDGTPFTYGRGFPVDIVSQSLGLHESIPINLVGQSLSDYEAIPIDIVDQNLSSYEAIPIEIKEVSTYTPVPVEIYR